MKLFAELKKRHFFKDTSIDFLGFRNVHNVYIPIENVDLHGIVVSLKKKITGQKHFYQFQQKYGFEKCIRNTRLHIK